MLSRASICFCTQWMDVLIYLPEIQSARCAHSKSNKKPIEPIAFLKNILNKYF